MRVIITGGAGFIGSSIADALLARGDEVCAIDNFCDFYRPELKRRNVVEVRAKDTRGHFQLIEADIRDADAMNRAFGGFLPDAVIHLAAMAGVRPSIENPALYTDVNLMGTVRILDAMRGCGCKRMAFASSSSVYGNSPTAPFKETDPVDRPISPYAATKKAGELLLHAEYALHGLSVACLRFFTVYGPRQRPDLAINKFARLIKGGEPVPMFGDGGTTRDYTYIADIVDGAVRAMDWTAGAAKYDLFNLGGGHTVTLLEMIQTLEKVVGIPAVIHRLPMQPGDVNRTDADVSHARDVLGYAPKTPFEQGIRAFIQWMEAQA